MQPSRPTGPPFAVVVDAARPGDPPGGVRLRARGEVDLATAPTLQAALGAAVGVNIGGDGGTAWVELDLAEVSFLDARGVSVLARAGAVARTGGGVLRLRGARPPVRRVLELTGVDTLCDLVD